MTVAAGAHDLDTGAAVVLCLGGDRALVALVECGPAAPGIKLRLERVDGRATLAAGKVACRGVELVVLARPSRLRALVLYYVFLVFCQSMLSACGESGRRRIVVLELRRVRLLLLGVRHASAHGRRWRWRWWHAALSLCGNKFAGLCSCRRHAYLVLPLLPHRPTSDEFPTGGDIRVTAPCPL
eukprot:scaffold63618_cov63-Phaeocystis_antarctica.AAC.2